jgi:hypothetical protein
MRTIIDVGASNGLFANFIANQSVKQRSSHSVRVFAVEPILKSAEQIGERENLTVIIKGIKRDDYRMRHISMIDCSLIPKQCDRFDDSDILTVASDILPLVS